MSVVCWFRGCSRRPILYEVESQTRIVYSLYIYIICCLTATRAAALASLAALARGLAALAAKYIAYGSISVAGYGFANAVYTTDTGLGNGLHGVGYSAHGLTSGL